MSKTINDVVGLVSGSSLHTSADNYSHQLGITWISVQSSKLFLSRAKPHVSKFSKWQVVVKAGLVDYKAADGWSLMYQTTFYS